MVYGASLKWLKHRQSDDGDEEQGGDFVVIAEEFAAAGFGVLQELQAEEFQRDLIGGEEQDEAEFGVQPALLEQVGLAQHQGEAESPSGGSGGEHDVVAEFARHGVQGGVGGGRAFRQIHKNPRQVKQPGKPCHHADEMESFENQVGFHGG